jgi:hypothetical protein
LINLLNISLKFLWQFCKWLSSFEFLLHVVCFVLPCQGGSK